MAKLIALATSGPGVALTIAVLSRESPAGQRPVTAIQSVLLVDGERSLTRNLCRALGILRPNLRLAEANTATAALRKLSATRFDVVVSELYLSDLDGIELLVKLRVEYPRVLCVIHSSHIESVGEDEVRRLAHLVFEKPAAPEALIEAVERAFALRAAR